MEVSRRTDYAIRILLELARSDGAPVSVRALAETQDVPYAFARGIQRELVSAGLVESRRGALGGIMLARRAERDQPARRGRGDAGSTLVLGLHERPGLVPAGWVAAAFTACGARPTRMVSEYLGSKSLAGLIESEGGR